MVVLCLLGSVSRRVVEYMNYYSNWITGQGKKKRPNEEGRDGTGLSGCG